MKEIILRKLHRSVGIVVAPFMIVQAVSGLMLGFGLFRRPGAGSVRPGSLDDILVTIHFKAGQLGDIYHILLGVGIAWMALTGWLIYLRVKRRKAPYP